MNESSEEAAPQIQTKTESIWEAYKKVLHASQDTLRWTTYQESLPSPTLNITNNNDNLYGA